MKVTSLAFKSKRGGCLVAAHFPSTPHSHHTAQSLASAHACLLDETANVPSVQLLALPCDLYQSLKGVAGDGQYHIFELTNTSVFSDTLLCLSLQSSSWRRPRIVTQASFRRSSFPCSACQTPSSSASAPFWSRATITQKVRASKTRRPCIHGTDFLALVRSVRPHRFCGPQAF